MAAVVVVTAPAGVPAPLWAAALSRVGSVLAPEIEATRARGVPDVDVRDALRETGPAFDRFVAARPALTHDATLDRWAFHWARSVVRLVAEQRFGTGSLGRWVVLDVVPALPGDVTACGPDLLDDLLVAAREVARAADPTTWARGLGAGLAAWPGAAPIEPEGLRGVGLLATWRAGHVRFRGAALRVAGDLPDAVVAAVLGVAGDVRAALRRNAAEPCSWPGESPGPRRVGAFAGFGGTWLVPPVVVSGDGHRWHVESGGTHWTVLTDAFGTAVVPREDAPPGGPPAAREAWWRSLGDDVTGAVAAGGACLVSRRTSHRLTLLPASAVGVGGAS